MARARRGLRAEDRAAAPALHRRARARLQAHRPARLKVGGWRLTIRSGSQVERERVDSLEEALFAARKRVVELEPTARREPAHAFVREVAPGEQVAARIELRGPRRRRGGVDLRGDGSLAAWTGLVSKRVVEAERGEDALGALGRALGG